MLKRKSPTAPTPEPPGSDASLYLLVGAGRMPVVGAAAGLVAGSESVWLRIEFNDMSSGRARHSGHFTVSGPPADVRALVAQLSEALDHPRAITP
jgi:hypothetical protein